MKDGGKLHVDWELVDNLLMAGCNGKEIASHIGMHEDTLYNRVRDEFNVDFSAYKQSKKAKGESLLRAKQFEVALSGDRTMLVWLGKQDLGQSDKRDVTTKGEKINSPNYDLTKLSTDELATLAAIERKLKQE